jgi:hypothetical protein
VPGPCNAIFQKYQNPGQIHRFQLARLSVMADNACQLKCYKNPNLVRGMTMSKFEDVLHEYETQKLQNIAAEQARVKREAELREEFSRSFIAAVASTARPVFTEFSTEARRHGFASSLEDGCDQNGNPYIKVHFVPVRYVVSSVDASRDCTFILMADLAEQQIVVNTLFQQWPEKNSAHKVTFSKRTLSLTTLNRLLYEFMRASLDGHDAS